MKKTAARLKVESLVHAEWNPRTPEELAWDNPDMVPLIDSVRNVGVIQPIAVWVDDAAIEDKSGVTGVVIAGNRRLEAAKAAGLEEIPALMFSETSEAQARMVTRVENEVRLGVDPMKDASLIGSMLGLGYSQKEIAAHFGVSEAKICRRRKLLELAPKIREQAESEGCNITIDALEQIAAYPREIQDRCTSYVLRRAKQSSTPVRWFDISHVFARETCDLDRAKFDCAGCKACPKRTGAQPDLWGDMGDDGKLGKCLDKGCYKRKTHDREIEKLRHKVGKRVELVDGEANGIADCYSTPDTFAKVNGKRDAKHPACWYWFCWNDEIEFRYGPTLADHQKWQEKKDEKIEKAKAKADKDAAKRKEEEERTAALMKERDELYTAKENAVSVVANKATNKIGYTQWKSENSAGIKMLDNTLRKCVRDTAQRSALANLLVSCFDVDIGLDDEIVAFCGAFPEFAKECKIKNEDFTAITTARAALDEFYKKHPEFKS